MGQYEEYVEMNDPEDFDEYCSLKEDETVERDRGVS